MDSGFGDDEAYNVYDKPWRADKDAASNIYRPTRNKDKDTYGDDLDELIKTNRSDVFLNAFLLAVLDKNQNQFSIAPDKKGMYIIFSLFLHKNMLCVLIKSASARHF